jgi:hypothetical protein
MPKRYSIAQARHDPAAIVHELEQQSTIELTRRGEPVTVCMTLSLGARYRCEPTLLTRHESDLRATAPATRSKHAHPAASAPERGCHADFSDLMIEDWRV